VAAATPWRLPVAISFSGACHSVLFPEKTRTFNRNMFCTQARVPQTRLRSQLGDPGAMAQAPPPGGLFTQQQLAALHQQMAQHTQLLVQVRYFEIVKN